MKKLLFLVLLLIGCSHGLYSFSNQTQWISSPFSQSKYNTWIAFRKQFQVDSVPYSALVNIAVDSKYWLWINGQLVVFEGGLKRGPSPSDTYYDELQIASYLKKGQNTIAIKLWYFGKDGFSHNSSGKAGLLFECKSNAFQLSSDKTWKTTMLNAYQTCPKPYPNYRLSESSILYDNRLAIGNWSESDFNDKNWNNAIELGKYNSAPWNTLVKRSIPLFKFSELSHYSNIQAITTGIEYDTIICTLPANIQITPYLKIKSDQSGKKIQILTDNYIKYNGGAEILRSEYISSKGLQEFEFPGWVNGHKVYYIVPKGIEVVELKYRESGYNAEFVGSFACSDPFFDLLWKKSARTLYLTMRDQFMDCPDRERAQWTGDAVLESGQCFYVMSDDANQLSGKWLDEFYGWQKDDGSLFSPSPAGNWRAELPGQSLATIGYYGLWNYYWYSGDKSRIIKHYDKTIRYLNLWKLKANGLVEVRQGDWMWGDWGDNKDMDLIFNLWYYLALKGVYNIAIELDKIDDSQLYKSRMLMFEKSFNEMFWNGTSYRSPNYKGQTDDRIHALAVVAGVAQPHMYKDIMRVFETQEHASPYMEKYVFEAMLKMGYVNEALNRHKKRFSFMVNHPDFSTLFEGWGIGKDGFGGGTVNHAWSGGGLTVLMSQVAGIKPAVAGLRELLIEPKPGYLKWIKCSVPHKEGIIYYDLVFNGNKVKGKITLPPTVKANFIWRGKVIRLNGGSNSIKL